MLSMQTASKKTRLLPLVLGFVGCAAVLVDFSATPARAQEAQGKEYVPGLGDLMNSSMQVHHTKLWFSGHADNWALATYELKEIRETIEDIGSFSPDWEGKPVGEMVKSLDPFLDLLDQAIKAKNPVKFDAAFHQLTGACNACHSASGLPEIKIVVPLPQGGGAFADQDFTTGRGPQ